jgi:hypothetical protein
MTGCDGTFADKDTVVAAVGAEFPAMLTAIKRT